MKKVLIVDDIPGWIRFHQNNIEHLNIEKLQIDTANSAREGLAKIEASIDNPYCAIFTDLQMESDFLPKTAGEWFIQQIKTYNKYYSKTKIIIVSASPSIKQIAQHNNVDYIPKSIIRNAEAKIYANYIL
ncbi:response regulator [bacterium]|nr:response regulator [bacterium]